MQHTRSKKDLPIFGVHELEKTERHVRNKKSVIKKPEIKIHMSDTEEVMENPPQPPPVNHPPLKLISNPEHTRIHPRYPYRVMMIPTMRFALISFSHFQTFMASPKKNRTVTCTNSLPFAIPTIFAVWPETILGSYSSTFL